MTEVPRGIRKDAGGDPSRHAGTPYVYQGEELGMTNVRFPDISDYKDIETLNLYRERLEGGYEKEDIMCISSTPEAATTPARPCSGVQGQMPGSQPERRGSRLIRIIREINAEEERKDPDSVYHFYQKLIRLRKTHPVFVDGKFDLLLPEDERIFAYIRQTGRIRCSSVQTLREKRRRARWM